MRTYGTPNLTKLHSGHDDYYIRNPKTQVDMTIIQVDFPFQDDLTIIQVDFPFQDDLKITTRLDHRAIAT